VANPNISLVPNQKKCRDDVLGLWETFSNVRYGNALRARHGDGKSTRAQLAILYDIYCLMLLKGCRGNEPSGLPLPTAPTLAGALDAILPGVSIRESQFPISMS
jgi:hypothetical protein